MPILYQDYITKSDLKSNPDKLYLYGCNEARFGRGGQAREMRYEPNSVGIRTKVYPGRNFSDYWSDTYYYKYCKMINDDLLRVEKHLRNGGTVVIPSAGIGTDRADMKNRCPKVFEYLQFRLKKLAEI